MDVTARDTVEMIGRLGIPGGHLVTTGLHLILLPR
jgi:hypothetical protein